MKRFSFLSLFPDGSGYLGQPDRVRRQPRRRQLRQGQSADPPAQSAQSEAGTPGG